MIPQIDRWVSTRWLRLLGGVRTYGSRLQFYLGLLNTFTLMIVLYHQSPTVEQTFPSVYVWLLFVGFVFVPSVVLVDYVVMHPSQIAYNQHQIGHENRSPTYREVLENQRRLERLERQFGGKQQQGGYDDDD